MKNLFYVIIFVMGSVFTYFWFIDIEESTPQEYGIDIVDPNRTIIIDNELSMAREKIEWLSSTVREVLELNKKRISKNNCKGVFYDANEDNVYDAKLFGESFKHNENIVFHYNFCSYTRGEEKALSIMATTKVLLDSYLEPADIEKNYVPSVILRSISVKKDNERVVKFEESVGLIDTKLILGY